MCVQMVGLLMRTAVALHLYQPLISDVAGQCWGLTDMKSMCWYDAVDMRHVCKLCICHRADSLHTSLTYTD
jgi:hypothetical protein